MVVRLSIATSRSPLSYKCKGTKEDLSKDSACLCETSHQESRHRNIAHIYKRQSACRQREYRTTGRSLSNLYPTPSIFSLFVVAYSLLVKHWKPDGKENGLQKLRFWRAKAKKTSCKSLAFRRRKLSFWKTEVAPSKASTSDVSIPTTLSPPSRPHPQQNNNKERTSPWSPLHPSKENLSQCDLSERATWSISFRLPKESNRFHVKQEISKRL